MMTISLTSGSLGTGGTCSAAAANEFGSFKISTGAGTDAAVSISLTASASDVVSHGYYRLDILPLSADAVSLLGAATINVYNQNGVFSSFLFQPSTLSDSTDYEFAFRVR
jgi:hypothetical protein